MKTRVVLPLFFSLFPSVLLAQNATAPQGAVKAPAAKPASRSAVVENFPSREQAAANWQQAAPPQQESRLEPGGIAGPETNASGTPTARVSASASTAGRAKAGGGKVVAPPLPEPKIDYVKEAIERTVPMTPADIQKFKGEVYDRATVMANPPGGPYTLKGTRLVHMSFAPGAKAETVDVALNLGAVVMFMDRAGNPLVVDGAKGFSSGFSVGVLETDEVKTKGSSSIQIMPTTPVSFGNVMVTLAGVANPVILQVQVGKSKAVDSLVQVVVPVLNPSTTVLPGDRLLADSGTKVGEMQGFLMGIPPEGAVDVRVRQVGSTNVWMWQDKLFVRTPYTIFSPGWFQRQAAADGTAVYEMPLTSVVRMGVDGREVEAIFDLPYIPPSVGTYPKKK